MWVFMGERAFLEHLNILLAAHVVLPQVMYMSKKCIKIIYSQNWKLCTNALGNKAFAWASEFVTCRHM